MTNSSPGTTGHPARAPWVVEGIAESTVAAAEKAAAASDMTPGAWLAATIRRADASTDAPATAEAPDDRIRAAIQERIAASEAQMLSLLEPLHAIIRRLADRVAALEEKDGIRDRTDAAP